MHTPAPTQVKEPTHLDLSCFAERTTNDILRRSASVVDGIYGEHYAMKNPGFTSLVARIMFDEFCVLRAHHGAMKNKRIAK